MIGTQTGFVACRDAEILNDPAHKAAYTNRAATLTAMKDRLNEQEARLVALEISVFGESPPPKFP
jgi:hypothetical protein